MSNYRDDLEASHTLVDSLRRQLADAHEEIARLQRNDRLDTNVRNMDPAELLALIPEAPTPPSELPPLETRSGDAALEWMSRYFEEFADVWLDTYMLTGKLLFDKRKYINPIEVRGDPSCSYQLTGLATFLCSLWVEVPFYRRRRWPFYDSVFKANIDSSKLDAHLGELEQVYLKGWPSQIHG